MCSVSIYVVSPRDRRLTSKRDDREVTVPRKMSVQVQLGKDCIWGSPSQNETFLKRQAVASTQEDGGQGGEAARSSCLSHSCPVGGGSMRAGRLPPALSPTGRGSRNERIGRPQRIPPAQSGMALHTATGGSAPYRKRANKSTTSV